MSNITQIGNAAQRSASVLELVEKLENPLIALGTTTDALESIEDDFADVTRDRGVYAQLWLIREKLRAVHEEIETLYDQARAACRAHKSES